MSRRPDRFTPDRIDTLWRREAARAGQARFRRPAPQRSGFSGKTLGLVLALGMMIGSVSYTHLTLPTKRIV